MPTNLPEKSISDDWKLTLARSVNELVSAPEWLAYFQDKLEEWYMREMIRYSEIEAWKRRREWYGWISGGMHGEEAGPPSNHPDWVIEQYTSLDGRYRWAWMPPQYAAANEPSIPRILPLERGERPLWGKVAILAAVCDMTLPGLDPIALRNNPQSDTSADELTKRAICFANLRNQIPKLTERDRPALEKYLADVRHAMPGGLAGKDGATLSAGKSKSGGKTIHLPDLMNTEGKEIAKHATSKQIADHFHWPLNRVRTELSKGYWGPLGKKGSRARPDKPFWTLNKSPLGKGSETQFLWVTELVVPYLKKIFG